MCVFVCQWLKEKELGELACWILSLFGRTVFCRATKSVLHVLWAIWKLLCVCAGLCVTLGIFFHLTYIPTDILAIVFALLLTWCIVKLVTVFLKDPTGCCFLQEITTCTLKECAACSGCGTKRHGKYLKKQTKNKQGYIRSKCMVYVYK